MTNTLNLLVAVCLGYVALLFLVAFAAERAAIRGQSGWLRSPIVYTLSLSIYCTAWTFYGAVGYAARSGLEFLTIYLGPTLVMIGWWWVLRKLVRIGRTQRVTSIADLISSRYGKSNLLAVFVTLIAVIGTTPYISLQLQSIATSFSSFSRAGSLAMPMQETKSIALWVAIGLAFFTILFGTRNLDANERHHGIVMAIAVEAVVKLFALLAVGFFVVWGIVGGVEEMLQRIDASELGTWKMDGGRWVGLTFLSAAAFLTLPRMFHVLVVENQSESHLKTAGWLFPLYLLLISLFVMPIAVVGLEVMPIGANPDQFVLTVPLSQGQHGLALLSFLGGFSSATSMVIVAAIALATMVSNHVVVPIWLGIKGGGAVMTGDVRNLVITARRFSIIGVLGLGYVYYRASGGGAALAAIGLVSFAGVAQFLPAMIGGIFWRGATRTGALIGLSLGFALWVWCLLLPSLSGTLLSMSIMQQGPFGLGWLRPQALFGIEGLDPLVHAVLWTMLFNTGGFLLGSFLSFPTPLERLQGAQFVNVFEHSGSPKNWSGGIVQSEDLIVMAQRILGPEAAQAFFQSESAEQGLAGLLPEPTPEFLARLERELAGSVGAATAHAMVGQIMGAATVSVEDLLAVADETAQMMEHSSQLEMKSEELARTARQLRAANEQMTKLSVQKDAFLSQISHELRTPMTSILAFSEILRDGGLNEAELGKYANIIHLEAVRLTRLLDDLLDLSVLENGQVNLNMRRGTLSDVIDMALSATSSDGSALQVIRKRANEQVTLETDLDRLSQVFINLITNAQKYCDANPSELRIRVRHWQGEVTVDFIDNGSGIPQEAQSMVFEKFSRVSDQKAGGAGLGLAICREIMTRLGGTISYLPGQSGAAFRVMLPKGPPPDTA